MPDWRGRGGGRERASAGGFGVGAEEPVGRLRGCLVAARIVTVAKTGTVQRCACAPGAVPAAGRLAKDVDTSIPFVPVWAVG